MPFRSPMEFKVGDAVQIVIPHSPAMRVVEIAGSGYRCAWEDGTGNYREGIFDATSLERCREADRAARF